MGLDDIAKGVGEVKSDKNEAEITRRGLEIILSSNPYMAKTLTSYSSGGSRELIVEVVDDVIQDEISGVTVGEEAKNTAEEIRSDLIEKL